MPLHLFDTRSMLGGAQLRAEAQYVFITYVIWYFGEFINICTYGFRFIFQVLLVQIVRVWDDCRAHTTSLHLGCMTMFWITILLILKMIFLGIIFETLQIDTRALVWGIRTYSRVCLNSNWGFVKKIQKKGKYFYRKRFTNTSKGVVDAIDRAQVSFPKILIHVI